MSAPLADHSRKPASLHGFLGSGGGQACPGEGAQPLTQARTATLAGIFRRGHPCRWQGPLVLREPRWWLDKDLRFPDLAESQVHAVTWASLEASQVSFQCSEAKPCLLGNVELT